MVPKGETQLRQQQLRQFDAQHVTSLGHPPESEIRRSESDSSLRRFPSGVTHSATAKAVPAHRSAILGRFSMRVMARRRGLLRRRMKQVSRCSQPSENSKICWIWGSSRKGKPRPGSTTRSIHFLLYSTPSATFLDRFQNRKIATAPIFLDIPRVHFVSSAQAENLTWMAQA